jgi:integrase
VSAKANKKNPYKRYETRHTGITYRVRSDGGRTYFVTVGSRHLRVDGGEKEALLVQADLRSRQARGLRVTPDATTFAELAENWFENGKVRWRRSTQGGYRIALDVHLLPAFGPMLLSEITPDAVAAFIAARLASGASHSYVAANLRPVNGVFKLALRRGLVQTNPVSALLPEERPKPKRRKRRMWTPDEIRRLLEAARELGARVGNVFDYTPVITTAVYTGMRPSELLGLCWLDVDLKRAVIHVRHQLDRETRTLVPPKTDAGVRDVPIPPLLVSYLRRCRLQASFSQDEHFVFCTKKGTPLDHRNVSQRGFEAAAEHAGLNRTGEPKLTTYDLRHAFASVVANHGIAAVDFAVFMGHEDSRVTDETYIHPFNQEATAARLRDVLQAAMSEQAGEPG